MEPEALPLIVEKLESVEINNKTITTFSEFFNELCKELNESDLFFELTKEFVALKTDLERMKYVWSIPQLQDIKFIIQRHVNKFGGTNSRSGMQDVIPEASSSADPWTLDLIESNAALLSIPHPHKNNNANPDGISQQYAKRAEVLSQAGRFEDALKDIKRALSFKCSPDICRFLQERVGKIYESLNQPDKALEAYIAAREICIETKNREMTSVYDAIIKSVKKSSGSQAQTSSKGKVKKTQQSVIPQHICEKTSLEIESVNPDIPCASSAVSISQEHPSGKSLVAVRDIKPGEVLAMEPPYACGVVSKGWTFTHCHYCLKRCDIPIPCFFCSDVAFCNEECRDKGWKETHNVECRLLQYLSYKDEDLDDILTSMRIILKAGFKTLHGLYMYASERHKLEDLQPFEIDSKAYLSVYNLPFQETFALPQFRNSVNAYLCVQLLAQHSSFFEYENSQDGNSDFRIFVSSLLLRHLSNIAYKSSAIIEMAITDGKISVEKLKEFFGPVQSKSKHLLKRSPISGKQFHYNTIGRGIYPVIALTDHSCDPNAMVTFHGKSAIMRSVKSIKKGEKITCEQIRNCRFSNETKEKRQEMILKQYKKLCECVACRGNYPTQFEMSSMAPKKPLRVIRDGYHCDRSASEFNMKESAQWEKFRVEFEAAEKKLAYKMSFCSCPSTLASSLACLEVLEKYCNRPNNNFITAEDSLIQIFRCQGNCFISHTGRETVSMKNKKGF